MAVQPTPDGKKLPTILFIPGAWHHPWIFNNVRSALSTRGYETDAAGLATVGAKSASIGMIDDAAEIRSALLKLVDAGKEVVIVAHSYGGIVASNAVRGLSIGQLAGAGKPGGVLMLVYLCAFVIPAEMSLLDALDGVYPDWWDLIEDHFITPINPAKVFYDDVEPSLAAKAVAALEQMPLQTVRDKSAYAPMDETFEVGYIFTEKDQALDVSVQRGMFSRFPAGSFSASLDSNHSPFLSMPVALADTIQKSVYHVLAKKPAR